MAKLTRRSCRDSGGRPRDQVVGGWKTGGTGEGSRVDSGGWEGVGRAGLGQGGDRERRSGSLVALADLSAVSQILSHTYDLGHDCLRGIFTNT